MKGTYRWRCHSTSTLSDDHIFYTSGNDYDDSKHQELQALIDNHPDCKLFQNSFQKQIFQLDF